ncbi:MAG TPA: hypothetical protein VE666_17870 [Mycobacterium sp.]|nr:hypothetical protein [Mycobacterium sp.]
MTARAPVVELRVHGVSGTPPEAMLGSPADSIERVAGDDDAGFYRRKDRVGELEAYSWGKLTSGPASRAVWLLFLPFIFINLAHWMLPPALHRRPAAVAVGLLRVIALTFTLTLMLSFAVVMVDVFVWQCVGLEQCVSRLGPLSYLRLLPRGVQVASSALPLVLVIVALWRLGRENSSVRGRAPDPAVTVSDVPLESATFWVADPSVVRLRACHVMAWTAGLAALMLVVPTRYAASPGVHAISVGLMAVNGLLVVFAVSMAAWNPATARGGASADHWTRSLMWSRWISLGVLAASLVWVIFADTAYPAAPTHFPGLHGAVYVLFGIQCALLVGAFAFTALSMRGRITARDSGFAPSLGGFTAPFVALIGWLVAGAFSIGVGLLAAQVLGKAVLSTATAREIVAEAPLIVPPPYFWAAVGIVVLILTAIPIGLWAWWWVKRRRTPQELREVLKDYPGAVDTDARAKQVASSRAWAAVSDRAPTIAAGLALLAVAEIAVMLVWYLVDKTVFESLPRRSAAITNVSAFIASALAAALLALTLQAYRNRELRRVVAVLWDVVTFWPRANHPLTPPSYGERTVPELRDRLTTLTSQRDVRVVLAAYSQGSLIAAATLLQGATVDRVALLTFGSPLRRLYARNFPAYFGTRALPRLRARQRQRWIDLWARSDPIGGWVFDDKNLSIEAALKYVDCRLYDVQSLTPQNGMYPPINGHSGFWTRPEYREAMTALVPADSHTDMSANVYPTKELM